MLLLALAIAPVLAIAVFIYWKNKFNKESRIIMFFCFVFGMISIFISIYLEGIPEQLGFKENDSSITNTILNSFLFIALIEESCKYFFLRIFAYPRKAFKEPYDGITYAVMISLGFATVENIHYVLQGGVEMAFVRMFTAVPAHATFGVIMGYFTGLAKFHQRQKSYLFIGIIAATLLHGTYDFFTILQIMPGLYIGAIISLIIGIILSFQAIRIHRKAPKI